MESQFGIIDGVIRTRVGYAGGETENPDYGNIGDHTEAVQVDYDPRRISYAQLLDIFWASHTPDNRSWLTQYRNAIFYHDAKQRAASDASRKALAAKTGKTIRTVVAPLRSFTLAENYHQKYLLKQRTDLTAEMVRIYPLDRDFIDSTAVARLNGYVGGNGSALHLAREIDSLGLSDTGRQTLKTLVH
ncbi:MAG: peptide-methionine (S)-S-oxide reductase [Desulfobacterales bacterium]|nr:peptide-methionine (S)-S-oxide reductase [Desulfobacterales bacterium]